MKRSGPPRWVIDFVEWFCHSNLSEGILGDLYEKYERNIYRMKKLNADWLFFWHATGFVRWRFRDPENFRFMFYSIWSNYILTTIRAMRRHTQFFAINLVGLIFAVSCSLFCLVYINDETKFDQFHKESDQIFRLYKRHLLASEHIDHLTAETSGLMGPTMLSQFPEVEEVVRIRPFEKVILYRDGTSFQSDNWIFADSSFFDVFSFELLTGDARSALAQPRSLILTASFAKIIFGNANPVGETIQGFGDIEYIVTGVVDDPPRRSSMQFDMIGSWSTTVPGVGPLAYTWMNNWLAQGIYTYARINERADINMLERKLPEMMSTYFPERADQYFLRLQPFDELHLHSNDIRNQSGLKLGNIQYVYILGFSALMIIFIVLINYTNITLSRTSEHRLEVGIRKVLGSSNAQLIGRFVSETMFTTLLASLIGFALISVLLPRLNALTGKDLPLSELFTFELLFTFILFSLSFSLILGLYPAYIMSKPKVANILQRTTVRSTFNSPIKKLLLGMQYAISLVLLICAIAISRQTQYLKNKPLGFDKDNLLVIDIDNEVGSKADILKSELLKSPVIDAVSVARSAIGSGSYTTTFVPEGSVGELGTRVFSVDSDFFPTYNIPVIRGRNFHSNSVSDSLSVIINRSFLESTNWKDPIGKRIKYDGFPEGFPIVGMVDDFHYHSLATSSIEPMAMFLSIDDNRCASIRIAEGHFDATLKHLEAIWSELSTQTPLSFYHVDRWYEGLYESESQVVQTAFIYSFISILLSVLGLYGVIAILLQHRAREISVRRVLGADIKSIISLFNRQFISILLVSLMIAIPIGYQIASIWLEDFVYKINLGAAPFLIASIIVLTLSVILISTLAGNAALKNPVTNLGES
ncbi:MAG: FtsX-like permease family protein [Saprospiraceae bacterium]|nr:FtsX-like permease family protein [Saprospiraceae bacterium]